MKTFKQWLFEEGEAAPVTTPANNTTGASVSEPVVDPKKKKKPVIGLARRNAKLDESLDKPWKLHQLPTQFNISTPEHLAKHGITDEKTYVADNGDTVISHKREGAYEIHHISNGKSDGLPQNKEANLGFVSTMYHLAKNLLSDGKPVRIVADKGDNKNHYFRLATKLKDKNGNNYHVGTIEPYSLNEPGAKNKISFVVKPIEHANHPSAQNMINNMMEKIGEFLIDNDVPDNYLGENFLTVFTKSMINS